MFHPIALAGIWPGTTMAKVVAFNWTMKVLVEVVLAPLTCVVVGFLERREGAACTTRIPASRRSRCARTASRGVRAESPWQGTIAAVAGRPASRVCPAREAHAVAARASQRHRPAYSGLPPNFQVTCR